MAQTNRRTGGTFLNPNGGNLDIFGRVRVSIPQTRFEYANQYNAGPLVWAGLVAGTGAVTHRPDRAAVELSTSGAGSVVRQTLQYLRYRPGRSHLSDLTFNLKALPQSGVKRVGVFDDRNGVFLEATHEGLFFVQRSDVTGSVVDSRYPQAEWNIDRMDGSGLSGLDFDISKAQVLQISMGWLGVEGWTASFAYENQVFPAHMVDYANKTAVVFQKTANLPARYEVVSSGPAETMDQICTAVFSESADDLEQFYSHSALRTTSVAVTTRRPILSIRPSLTFGGQTNRGVIVPESYSIWSDANAAYEIVYNATLTGASFASVGSNSIADVDTSATALSGGEVFDSGYLAAAGVIRGQEAGDLSVRYPVVVSPDGLSSYPVTIVGTAFTGTANMRASITFREYY